MSMGSFLSILIKEKAILKACRAEMATLSMLGRTLVSTIAKMIYDSFMRRNGYIIHLGDVWLDCEIKLWVIKCIGVSFQYLNLL